MIGTNCKSYRQRIGYTQQQVADELGYTKGNVSAFENERNSNMYILLWYLEKGMTVEEVLK